MVDFVQASDFALSSDKSAFWTLLNPLGQHGKNQFNFLRNRYSRSGFSLADSWRLAALDVAADLPGAADLPVGLLASLRPKTADGVSEQVVVSLSTGGKKMTPFERLLAAVQERPEVVRSGFGSVVSWVSANLSLPPERVEVAGVPSVEALSLYKWARSNETEYRRLYDSKRIPSRGLMEDREVGLIDGGEEMAHIMARLVEGLSKTGDSNVPMRHLQAAESNGNDIGSPGGVHGLPGGVVTGSGGGDTGGGGGSDSVLHGGSGVDVQGSSGAGSGVADG